jgi:hypothetical protein
VAPWRFSPFFPLGGEHIKDLKGKEESDFENEEKQQQRFDSFLLIAHKQFNEKRAKRKVKAPNFPFFK